MHRTRLACTSFSWEVNMESQRLKALLFKVFSLPFLLLICTTVIANGLRSMSGYFAGRLSSWPGLGFLAAYEGWHKLDVAGVVAVGLLALEYFLLVIALRYFLVPGAMKDTDNWLPENERILAWVFFVVLTLGEALCFFRGVLYSETGWDEGPAVLTGLAGSLLYMIVVVGVAYLTVRFERS
jgi:hypothetical protein